MRKLVLNNDFIELDDGLFFGKGIFETILIKDKPIFLKEHIYRANKSIELLNLGEKLDLDYIKKVIYDLNLKNKVLKIIVTKNNLIFCSREIIYKEKNYLDGFNVKISDIIKCNKSKLVYIKSVNYLENLLELEETKKLGFNESIFFNNNGFLTEGCTSNIFLIKDNKIYTPKLECGLLDGIIRSWIIKNFDVIEKNIVLEELNNSDEIFLTNSIVGIIKVKNIYDKEYKSDKINKIRKKYLEVINFG